MPWVEVGVWMEMDGWVKCHLGGGDDCHLGGGEDCYLGGGEEERQSLARPSSHLPSTVSKAVNEADLGVGVMLGVFSRLNPDPNPDPDAASGSLSCLLASASIAFFLLLLLPGRLLCCTTFSSPPSLLLPPSTLLPSSPSCWVSWSTSKMACLNNSGKPLSCCPVGEESSAGDCLPTISLRTPPPPPRRPRQALPLPRVSVSSVGVFSDLHFFKESFFLPLFGVLLGVGTSVLSVELWLCKTGFWTPACFELSE